MCACTFIKACSYGFLACIYNISIFFGLLRKMQALTYLFISVFHCVALRSPWLKVDVFNFIFLYGITVYALVEFFPLALGFFITVI